MEAEALEGLDPGSGCVPPSGGRSRQWLEESSVGEAACEKPTPKECRFPAGSTKARLKGGD